MRSRFSRSSSLSAQATWTNAGAANDLTFLPQAIDAVGVAEQVNGTAVAVSNLNTGALTAIYTGGTYTQSAAGPTVGDVQESGGYRYLVTGVGHSRVATSFQVVPVLPQAGSGIRGFFLNAIAANAFAANIVANETGTVAEEEDYAAADLSKTDMQIALNKNGVPYNVPGNSTEIVPLPAAAVIAQLHGLDR
jgi:hypothetical protein